MKGLSHVEWGTVFAAATSLAALILSYLTFRRQQNIRREEISDKRRSQAKLVTAWWTRVRKDNEEDLALGAITTAEWPPEAGYRVWISNSSDDAVYDCMVFASIELTPEAVAQLAETDLIVRPYMAIDNSGIVLSVGTLPPRQPLPYRLDPALIASVGTLRIDFRDSDGVYWRRVAGKLTERPSEEA